VTGASIDLTASSSTLVVGGASSTLSATVKNALGVAMQGVTVSFAATDSSVLGLAAATATTNASGVATITVAGLAAGSADIIVSALGNAKSQTYTSGNAASVLAVTAPANNSVVVMSLPKTITVSAPGATTVTFATTLGTFSNSAAFQTINVVGGTASALLTASQAGTATITIIDSLARNANLALVVSPPASSVNKLLLTASQTTLPIATVGSLSSLTITARAVVNNGISDQSVADAPIVFSMTGGPGAGEFLSPALVYTNSAGYAVATFTAGTAASIPNGITISATVQSNPAVQTGVAPSSNSAQITIGGQALSVAFGPASVLGESSDKTLYIQAYSVQVTDANNNPVPDQLVTLRMRPVAFSTGNACTIVQTFCSEDVNGNNSLDIGEDGSRTMISNSDATTAGSCPAVAPTQSGSLDGNLTPQNSDGGGVPSIVTTDSNGIAGFNMTYLKGSAIWVINKLTATVSSSGTETSKSTIFRLAPTVSDSGTGSSCHLPDSPYAF
jgi:hypothetical protein